MNTELPFVSCIMPTANREKFVPIAIRYFLKQDYPNKELVIVDDGREPIEHLIPDIDGIQYLRMNNKAVIGAKRNIACQAAKGDIIVHWDDDDWYASDWVSCQVRALEDSGADICGLDQVLFYDPLKKKAWKYVYPKTAKPWVAGATMACRKSLWQQQPFREVQVGEDNYFVWGAKGKAIAHDYADGFVAMVHQRNTSPKHVNNARWQPADERQVAELLADDLGLYST
ncbi:MAG: glycosyltransferase family 2 protein [Bacteroidetes bacterium]|nr:glycosyltransferase family 2 protein [Bacteroidota bacterium]